MRISILPASNDTTASARIRAYSLQKALGQQGITASMGFSRDCDVLFIQKRLTSNLIATAREFSSNGGLVVYDFDDLGWALDYWAPPACFAEMMEVADVITTNTIGFKNRLLKEFTPESVEIIPDIVDYYLSRPVRSQNHGRDYLHVLWFGNAPNVRLLDAYLPSLARLDRLKFTLCTDKSANLDFPPALSFSFTQWDCSSFPDILQSADISFLVHDNSDDARHKSNNRMITSIAWGVPAIVSNTPEYSKTAHSLGVPQAIIADPQRLAEAIDPLRDHVARQRYLDSAQSLLWRTHSPEAVALAFATMVRTRLRGKAQSRC